MARYIDSSDEQAALSPDLEWMLGSLRVSDAALLERLLTEQGPLLERLIYWTGGGAAETAAAFETL